MNLYLSNTTRQIMHFHFKLPERAAAMLKVIHSGHAEELKDLNKAQVESIIEQIRRFGGVEVSDLSKHPGVFSGLVYSEKPINEAQFHYGLDEVLDKAQDRSVIEATRSALAADRDPNTRRRRGKETVVEMEQDAPDGRPTGKELKMSITVSDDASPRASIAV